MNIISVLSFGRKLPLDNTLSAGVAMDFLVVASSNFICLNTIQRLSNVTEEWVGIGFTMMMNLPILQSRLS